MLCVIFLGEKVLPTEIAVVRLDLEVNSFPMVDQSRVGLKGRAALRTKVALDVFVHRHLVNS